MAKIPRHISGAWHQIARNDHVIMTVVALIVGVVVAYAVIGFWQLLDVIHDKVFGATAAVIFEATLARPWWQAFNQAVAWWRVLLVPVAGGLVIGLYLHFFVTDRRAHGIADAIEANVMRDGRISMRQGLHSALVAVTSLSFGASAGREGPVVHLGATLASWFTQRIHLPPAQARTLLGCGVASAVAASFNAPIAGVLFALEVVVGHYALHALAPVVIAGVAGTLVSRAYFGDFPAFTIPDYGLLSLFEMPGFLVLGIISAAVAVLFMKSIMFAEDVFNKFDLPIWLRLPIGGFGIGLIGLIFPQVMGVGYEATSATLQELLPLSLLLILIAAKIVATSISIGCRFGGGVFSPAIFVGAMTGAVFGILAADVFPNVVTGPGVYAIVGMAAVAAAVLGAPISTILIVFELTKDYQITIALMIAASTASLITSQMFKPSFFVWQLERRGLNLKGGRALNLLRRMTVRTIQKNDIPLVRPDTPLDEIRRQLESNPFGSVIVVDEAGVLKGTIGYSDLQSADPETEEQTPPHAETLMRDEPVTLSANENLEHALDAMSNWGEDHVPVIDDTHSRKFIGVAHHKDILLAYNRALMESHEEIHGTK